MVDKKFLKEIVDHYDDYIELRHHHRTSQSFNAKKGRVDSARHGEKGGVGVRVLKNNQWGFASTTGSSKEEIKSAIEKALENSTLVNSSQKKEIKLQEANLATTDYKSSGYDDLSSKSTEEKLSTVVDFEKKILAESSKIDFASCSYSELIEHKTIVTTDGACATMQIALPEFRVGALAKSGGEQITHGVSAGVNGGWDCLFKHPSLDGVIQKTAKMSVDLLKAKYPDGGKKQVILSPAVVGLLCHEAIGHTVEADFVKAGSVAAGKIGQRVASDLVNMSDTGMETTSGWAVGNIPFDDEGVPTEDTAIIKNGMLNSYLHNRETAYEFGVKPTGNSRAWIYDCEPLIRMRNTYLHPGNHKLAEMIASIQDGYLIEGAGSGQADANGEFMFGCSYIWEIKNGKKVNLLREATLSGIAFDVLQTVDMVSEEFQWDLGSGYCGKGQPAKVDAGGPYIRCMINVGGNA